MSKRVKSCGGIAPSACSFSVGEERIETTDGHRSRPGFICVHLCPSVVILLSRLGRIAQPAAPNPAEAFRFQFGRHGRRVGEPSRWCGSQAYL